MTAPGRNALNILAVARHVRDFCVAHFDVAGNPLPGRRMIVAGEPREKAWDCEQFTVGLVGIGQGASTTGEQFGMKAASHLSAVGVRNAVLAVQVVRCTEEVPDGGIPSAEAIEAAGEAFMVDSGMLSQALLLAAKSMHGAGLDDGGLAKAGDIVPLGIGGFHACEGTIEFSAMMTS